jgi:hypothetical protein
MDVHGGVHEKLHSFLTSALDGGESSDSLFGLFIYERKNDQPPPNRKPGGPTTRLDAHNNAEN